MSCGRLLTSAMESQPAAPSHFAEGMPDVGKGITFHELFLLGYNSVPELHMFTCPLTVYLS